MVLNIVFSTQLLSFNVILFIHIVDIFVYFEAEIITQMQLKEKLKTIYIGLITGVNSTR